MQRRTRKNNIIIFGVNSSDAPLLDIVGNIFNQHINVEITNPDINDIYRIGPKEKLQRPIIVEFTSFKTKQAILRNSNRLKGKKIFIAPDRCSEDRKTHKILSEHLKQAKERGIQAVIRGNRIVIGNETYTAKDLEQANNHQDDPHEEYKPKSAPSTPNPHIRQKHLLTEFGLETEGNEGNEKKTKPRPVDKSLANKTDRHISEKQIKTRSHSSSSKVV